MQKTDKPLRVFWSQDRSRIGMYDTSDNFLGAAERQYDGSYILLVEESREKINCVSGIAAIHMMIARINA